MNACNYNLNATFDDGNCEYISEGTCNCVGNILDECGICGGNGYADWECNDGGSTCWNIAEGDCDCDGNVDLGCGCNLPASISYCIDIDADNLGTGDAVDYCLADLPDGWVEDCSDLEPDCATNDTDECGVCAGSGIPEDECDCDGNVKDCASECGGTAELDACDNCEGTCSADEDGFVTCEQVEEYIADCAGVCEGMDGSLVNICIGVEDITSQSECEDAGGYWSEDGIDECNECGGDGTSCLSLYYGLIPEDFSIHNIYPNPFNPVTNIIYALPENVNVQIVVFNLSGKQVVTLINQFQTPGYHSVSWNADSHPSGLYFVSMTSGSYVEIMKLMLVK
jgi:hypothetical protein